MTQVTHLSLTAKSLYQQFGLALPVYGITTPIEVFSFAGIAETDIRFGLAGTSYFNGNNFRLFMPAGWPQLKPEDREALNTHASDIARQWGGKKLFWVVHDLPPDKAQYSGWHVKTQHLLTSTPDLAATQQFVKQFRAKDRYQVTPLTNKNSAIAHKFVGQYLGHSALATTKLNHDYSCVITNHGSDDCIACVLASGLGSMHVHALVIHPDFRRTMLYPFLVYQLSVIVVKHHLDKVTFSFFDDNDDMKKVALRVQNVERRVEHYLSTEL